MNNPTLVLDLICGNKYMTVTNEDDASKIECKLKFNSIDMDNLECDISLVTNKKPKKVIPLDFDEIEGFNGVVLLISAFFYPESNLSYRIYSTQTDSLEHIYTVNSLEDGIPRFVNCIQ